MKVRYIADHDKTDSIDGCGLRWQPGLVREVSATLGARLLHHRDTWEKVEDGASVTASEDPGQNKARSEEIDLMPKKPEEAVPVPVIDFHAMDKDALHKFAEDHLTEKMDKRWTEPVLRERVQQAWVRSSRDA